MRVVIKPASVSQRRVEGILARMAERRVAEIVSEAERLGKVFVEAERASDRATNLRDFETVSKAHAEMVAIGRDEHLRLVPEAAEGDRMNDAVAVALEDVARSARPGIAFRMQPSARVGWICG